MPSKKMPRPPITEAKVAKVKTAEDEAMSVFIVLP
jgi:hypothetical protein